MFYFSGSLSLEHTSRMCFLCPDIQATACLLLTRHRGIRNRLPPPSPFSAPATLAPCFLWICQAPSSAALCGLKQPGNSSLREPLSLLLHLCQLWDQSHLLREVFQTTLTTGTSCPPFLNIFYHKIYNF